MLLANTDIPLIANMLFDVSFQCDFELYRRAPASLLPDSDSATYLSVPILQVSSAQQKSCIAKVAWLDGQLRRGFGHPGSGGVLLIAPVSASHWHQYE